MAARFLTGQDQVRKNNCEIAKQQEERNARIEEGLQICPTLRSRLDACKDLKAEDRGELMAIVDRIDTEPMSREDRSAMCSMHAENIQSTCDQRKEERENERWRRSLARGDYGPRPGNYVALTRAFFRETLKDPYSAKYGRVSRPRKEYVVTDESAKEAVLGWSVCATVNAKNGFGAYTGNSTFWFFIVRGKIVDVKDLAEDDEIESDRPVNCANGP